MRVVVPPRAGLAAPPLSPPPRSLWPPSPAALAPPAAAAALALPAAAAHAANAQQRPPTENFLKVKELGRGTYGSVWLVHRQSDGKAYALKEQRLDVDGLPRTAGQAGPFASAALSEARLLGSLKHPNVVKLREAFLSSGGAKLNLVMELASGGDLDGLIKQAREAARRGAAAAALAGGGGPPTVKGLPEPLVWGLLLQAASGLAACHNMGVLHRDIKPKNLFLMSPAPVPSAGHGGGAAGSPPPCSPSPSSSPSSSSSSAAPLLKVGDLGVAKAAAITATQIGTPLYMPPEVVAGRAYGPACDSWSLGCVAYEMCALHPPFYAATDADLRALVLSGKYRPLPVSAAAAAAAGGGAGGNGGGNSGGYSPALARLVDALLSRDPTRRPSCADVLAGPWARAWAWTLPDAARAAIEAAAAGGLPAGGVGAGVGGGVGVGRGGPPKLPLPPAPPRPKLLPAPPLSLRDMRAVEKALPASNYSADGGVLPLPAAPAAPAAGAPAGGGGALLRPAAIPPVAWAKSPRPPLALPPPKPPASYGAAIKPYAPALGNAPMLPRPSPRVLAAAAGPAPAPGRGVAAALAAAQQGVVKPALSPAAAARAREAATPSWLRDK
jgi:serine/threonine protein kinase